MTKTIALTEDGAKARAFMVANNLGFEDVKTMAVDMLTIVLMNEPEPQYTVEVADEFVEMALSRGMDPGALLSQFLVDSLDALGERSAEPGVPTPASPSSEGCTEDV